MDKKNIITIILAVVITAGLVESRHFFNNSERHDHEISVSEDISDEDTTITSPYSGQETRWIKSLSQDDIQSLQEGSGVAFGGMAKLAELNGYQDHVTCWRCQKRLVLLVPNKNKLKQCLT